MGSGRVLFGDGACSQSEAGDRHSIVGDELWALRRLQREQEPKSPFVFTSERAAPFSTAGFAPMIERAGLRVARTL